MMKCLLFSVEQEPNQGNKNVFYNLQRPRKPADLLNSFGLSMGAQLATLMQLTVVHTISLETYIGGRLTTGSLL
jgi:hypothetical protein